MKLRIIEHQAGAYMVIVGPEKWLVQPMKFDNIHSFQDGIDALRECADSMQKHLDKAKKKKAK